MEQSVLMTLHEILKLALLLTVASHSLGLTNNMLRTTRVLGRAVQRSRRHNDLILQRRRPTQLWGERKSFLSTSAPKEAGGVLNFDDVAAPVFKAAPLTSPKFAANGVFAAKAVDVATINGVRPKASNKVSDDERHDDESTESHLPASSEASYPQPPAVSVGSARLALDAYIIDSAVVDTKSVENYPSIEAYLQDTGIRSQPVDGGNWKVPAPLQWTENFGRRSPEYETILRDIIQLQPGDEDYFDVSNLQIPDVAFVRTKEQAAIVLEKLMAADPAIFHACDTEVMDIDLKSVGPVGNGYCTCVSIYSGPDFDYGLGQGPGATLWIDNLDDACGILQEFKEWFENERLLKVWHNYGFDRHIMWNEGIDVRGFGGDTMHMARLQDSSRAKNEGVSGNGYSLEALTSDLLGERKQPMKEIFGIKRQRKDGTEGILVDMPPVEVMQRDPRHRAKWVTYSCYDARGTWRIRNKLADLLKNMPWIQDTNLYDYYWMHMRPFGEVLTDMERRGIRVNANDYLAKVELQAREDRSHHVKVFRQWAAKRIGADGLALNTASSVQLCTFLFGGAKNEKTKEITEQVRVFKVPRDEIPEDALEAYRVHDQTTAQSETLINGTSFPVREHDAYVYSVAHQFVTPQYRITIG